MVKKEAKKTVNKEIKTEPPKRVDRYIEAVGRRKTAIARVRISSGHGKFTINGKDLIHYFNLERLRLSASAPIRDLKMADKFDVGAKVLGGGSKAQAEAVRLGLARVLVLKNPEFKKRLRKLGFLTRDSRMVERKKYGLKKARRAPQWQKR
jgi:small subunit ribosomal protein S9